MDKTFVGVPLCKISLAFGVRFFHGVPLSKRGVPFRNFGTVRGSTQ